MHAAQSSTMPRPAAEEILGTDGEVSSSKNDCQFTEEHGKAQKDKTSPIRHRHAFGNFLV
jgi:hypothetical protein